MAPRSAPPESTFRSTFQRWSRRIRARIALDHALTGAAVGLVLGAAATTVAWQTRHGSLRPWSAAGGVLGAAVGLFVARRRRWDDQHVALYLDSKLGSAEAIATALELDAKDAKDHGGDEAPRAVVISQASGALERATSKSVRAPMWRGWHLAVPLAAGAIGFVSLLPLPPAPAAPPPPPGADKVQIAELAGLEKIIRLSDLDARDEAQKERLKKLSDDARKLRDKLRSGIERREAQADIAKIRDGITAERLKMGEGEQRQGLESALGKMGENPDLKGAAKALGDRDLTSFDEQMEKLANKLESADRERAKKTLEEAAEAAKKAGAPDLAKALEEQKKLLDQRGKQADKLRELAKALGEGLSEDAKEALKDFNEQGGGKEQQKLAQKLEEALEKLTPEQRKQLAENMKKQVGKMGEEGAGMPPSKQQLKDLADQLDTEEGQKQLEEQLKKMAEEPGPESEESERQQGLDDAQRGAGEAEGQLGGVPMPAPMAGGPSGKGPGKDGKGQDGPPGSNHSEGGGSGDKKGPGQTGVVEGDGVRARANSRLSKGKPMPGLVMGRTTGKPGETANVQGTGALGVVGPEEVGGVDRSNVPEEYREQVGRYFQPK